MKLHQLILHAFGPFPGTETIDFDALSEDGLFLLNGRTGSGKTFILDAVTFALYGQVAGERGVTRLRSDHAAPGAVPQVSLEFTLSGRRYRVTRDPQHWRPKQRGSGFIQENQKAHLEVQEAGSWKAAANGSQAVGKELSEILPLDRHQFTKVILLPQGDFAEFLHSSSNEKKQLLQRLFDTTTFQQLEDHLREQAKEAKAQVEEADREIEALRAGVLDGAQQLTGVDFSQEPDEEAAPGEETPPGEETQPAESEPAEEPETGSGAESEISAEPGGAAEDALDGAPEGAAQPEIESAELDQAGQDEAQQGPGDHGSAETGDAAEPAHPESEVDALARRITAEAQSQRAGLAAALSAAEDRRRRAQHQAEELSARARELARWTAHQRQLQEHRGRSEEVAEQRASLDRHRAAETLEEWFRSAERTRQQAAEHHSRGVQRAQSLQELLESQQDVAAYAVLRDEVEGGAEYTPDDGTGSGAESGTGAEIDSDQLQAARRELTELQGQLRAQDAQALETRQKELARRARELGEQVESQQQTLSAAEAAQVRLAEQSASQEKELRDPEELEEQRDAARAEQDRLSGQAESRRVLDSAQQELQTAQERLRERTSQAEAAAAAHEEALNEHLRGIAAELSGSLIPGQPCLVCGSVDHPQPAAADEQTVTRAQVRQALSAAEEAAGARTAAASAVEEKTQRVQTLTEELGEAAEQSREDLQAALEAAREKTSQAEQLRRSQRELQAQLAASRTELSEAEQRETTARAALTVARSEQERVTEDAARTESTLSELRGAHESIRTRSAALDRLQSALDEAEAALQRWRQSAQQADSSQQEAQQKLESSAFEDRRAVRSALLEEQRRQERQRSVEAWDRAELRLQEEAKLEEVAAGRRRAEAGEEPPDPEAVQQGADAAEAAAQQHQEALRALDRFDDRLEHLRQSLQRVQQAHRQREEQLAEQVRRTELADTINGRGPDNRFGMTLTTFVLAARLERVAEAATRHLQIMSEGRYRLLHDDSKRGGGLQGLELKVTDQHSDEERPTSSLSGGETFMASLAMALGLAEVVQADAGGVGLESLFIDEGFGSLDEETLEHVMGALTRLQGEGRRVGVVSHVTEMHQAIPVQLRVIRSPSGSLTQMHLKAPAAGAAS